MAVWSSLRPHGNSPLLPSGRTILVRRHWDRRFWATQASRGNDAGRRHECKSRHRNRARDRPHLNIVARTITSTSMSTRKKKQWARLVVVPSALALLAAAAFAEDWTVLRPNNRPYVTFGNVAQFYQFPEYTRVSRTVSLRSERRTIRAQAGTSELSINGVRFFTHFPLLNNNGEDLISVMDVSKIIEPVLRPSRISRPEKVETVVLDPGHGG